MMLIKQNNNGQWALYDPAFDYYAKVAITGSVRVLWGFAEEDATYMELERLQAVCKYMKYQARLKQYNFLAEINTLGGAL